MTQIQRNTSLLTDVQTGQCQRCSRPPCFRNFVAWLAFVAAGNGGSRLPKTKPFRRERSPVNSNRIGIVPAQLE